MNNSRQYSRLVLVLGLAIFALFWLQDNPGTSQWFIAKPEPRQHLAELQKQLNAQLMPMTGSPGETVRLVTKYGSWQTRDTWPLPRSGKDNQHFLLELLPIGLEAQEEQRTDRHRIVRYPHQLNSLETVRFVRIGYGDLENGSCYLEYRPGTPFQLVKQDCD